ncbi:diguanylate cyclase (GGDEF)-like protein [Rhodovulum bhavnagarense]|uniref:Diguanylate cyclase (GGDEF)-like protein n=1 Tax=Rhodovulum bhavnagarense TaxID=992286 RepID=A0A4R2REI1_9RHOB|nr:sensor domain-containing diguanylate cyclase [Rhodovulum bhavnagarense]TCP60659.1 diguanylate cyclase (GGDEF)-like protein [Rhodovulum bhavnagarense]
MNRTILEATHSEDRLAKGLRLCVDIINDVLSASDVELDRMIDKALARLGAFTDSDRTYVFRLRDGQFLDNTHEWVAPGIESVRNQLQGLSIEKASAWWEAFDTVGEMYIPDTALLDDDRPDKKFLQQQDVKSLLALPMRQNGVLSGFVGYDAVRKNRGFQAGEIDLIRTVANVFSAALEKRDAMRLGVMAMIDDLTALPNRRHFDLSLERALRKSNRSGYFGAIFFLDVDGFKTINDRYGHRGGDEFLSAFGARLRDAVRSSDLVARYGGDEFVALVDDLPAPRANAEAEALALANRVLKALGRPVRLEQTEPPVTLSMSSSLGLVIFGPGDDDIEDIINRADKAMYKAKKNRAGCVIG